MITESLKNTCKIGCLYTPKKTSHDRAKELFSTSIPFKYVVVYDIKVKNPFKYEKIIHNKLVEKRLNKNREFFSCNPEEIKEYFYMTNLIQSNEDIYDFHYNYFTEYNDLNKIIINKKNIINDKKDTKNISISTNKFDLLLKKHKNEKISSYDKEIELHNEMINLKNSIKAKDKSIESKNKKCLFCKCICSTKGNLKTHILIYCKIRQDLQLTLQNYVDEINNLRNELSQNNENNDNLNNLDKKTLIKMVYELTSKNQIIH